MAEANERSGQDHGLGIEVVDDSTSIAVETYMVETEAEKLVERQSASTAYWVIVAAVLILLCEQAVFSVVLYTPILPDVAAEFQTSQVVWMLTVYFLAAAVLAPLITKLGDVYGKRRMLLVSAAGVAVGSLISLIAPTFTWLLVGRVFTGLSITFLPLGVALMREIFPVRMRAVAIAMATNGFGVIVIVGPILAGVLAATWGVRAVFAFSLALCVVVSILVLLLVPESPLRVRSRIDYVGALLLGFGSLGLLVGFSELVPRGFDVVTVGELLGGLLLLIIWYIRQRTVREPLINTKLLTRRTISMPVMAYLLMGGVTSVAQLTVSLHWSASEDLTTYGFGLSALEIGLWYVPAGIVSVLAGLVVGLTSKSIGYRNHMVASGIIYAIPCIFYAINLHWPPVVMIALFAILGMANVFVAASMSLVLLAAPDDQRGVALGLNGSLGGLSASGTQQVAAVVLSLSVVATVGGVPVYSAAGMRTIYIGLVVLALTASFISVFIPQGRRMSRSDRAFESHEPNLAANADDVTRTDVGEISVVRSFSVSETDGGGVGPQQLP